MTITSYTYYIYTYKIIGLFSFHLVPFWLTRISVFHAFKFTNIEPTTLHITSIIFSIRWFDSIQHRCFYPKFSNNNYKISGALAIFPKHGKIYGIISPYLLHIPQMLIYMVNFSLALINLLYSLVNITITWWGHISYIKGSIQWIISSSYLH